MPFLTLTILRLGHLTRSMEDMFIRIFLIISILLAWPAFSSSQEVPLETKPPQTIAADSSVANTETTKDTDSENTDVTKALEDLLKAMKLGNFEYQVEDRPDPFMPFITEKTANTAETDTETGERLTGMRQFEPGQLHLVAIVFTETNPLAMVEDSSHKGYLIHRGTKIGKTGIVTDILPNEVIIKQLSYSMDQAPKYSTMEMILRKEGEK